MEDPNLPKYSQKYLKYKIQICKKITVLYDKL